MTASIIKPTTVTDAMLVSSTAPETVAATYAGGTTYSAGQMAGVLVGTTQTIYESLQDSNTGHTPASSPTWWRVVAVTYSAYSGATSYALGDIVTSTTHTLYESLAAANVGNALTVTAKWKYIGPSNRWAMFDRKIGTKTSVASPLTAVVNSGRVSGLALLELVGRTATITLKTGPGGTVIYTATKSLDATIVESFYDWFFEDYLQLSNWVITDLPSQYNAPELTVTLTSSVGNVECGVCHVGQVTDLGDTQYGARSGIVDYSKKTVDDQGNYDVTEGAYSKRCTLQVATEKADFQKIHRFLSGMRATPAIYIGTEADGFDPLTVYGFFKSFDIDVSYPAHHLCALEIEGLTQ